MKLKLFLARSNVPYQCEICKNPGEWNGQPLTLQVDHIDGDNKNNELSNLRYLCPNCHTQTDTFAGRNKKNKSLQWKDIDESEYITALQECTSISGAIKYLKLNEKNSLIRAHINSIKELHGIKFKLTEFDQDKVNQIMNSKIDFSTYGWVKHVAEILGISPQKVGQWMRNHMIEFYENKCYRRKMI